MGIIKQRVISWGESNAVDLASYRVYWKKKVDAGDVVTYDDEHQDVGLVTEITLPDDISSSMEWEGDYSIGITALDNTGNESPMTSAESFFDFVAPPAPGFVTII